MVSTVTDFYIVLFIYLLFLSLIWCLSVSVLLSVLVDTCLFINRLNNKKKTASAVI